MVVVLIKWTAMTLQEYLVLYGKWKRIQVKRVQMARELCVLVTTLKGITANRSSLLSIDNSSAQPKNMGHLSNVCVEFLLPNMTLVP
jgi:hypothetical protein